MGTITDDILEPRSIRVPQSPLLTTLSGQIGMLQMSGAKLYVCTANSTWELVTSA